MDHAIRQVIVVEGLGEEEKKQKTKNAQELEKR